MQNSLQKLLLEQYKSIRFERIINEVISRIMWLIFIALMIFSKNFDLTTLFILLFSVFIYTYVMVLKLNSLNNRENYISSTLARLNPMEEDNYIKYLHQKLLINSNPSYLVKMFIKNEQFYWLALFIIAWYFSLIKHT